MEVSGQLNAPAALPPRNLSWYSLNERVAPSPLWTGLPEALYCALCFFLLSPSPTQNTNYTNWKHSSFFTVPAAHTGMCSCDITPATLHNFATNYTLIIPSYCCYFIGVSHADELGYLFHTAISPPVSEDSQEMKVLLKMIRMWTNFAKTGYVHIHKNGAFWCGLV
jgi:hypothetical protein